MRFSHLTSTALVLAFGIAAGSATAQQRTAPNTPPTGDQSRIDREMIIEKGVKPPGKETRPAQRSEAQPRPQPERDPPMPKPVPSIIRP